MTIVWESAFPPCACAIAACVVYITMVSPFSCKRKSGLVLIQNSPWKTYGTSSASQFLGSCMSYLYLSSCKYLVGMNT